jgi:hypothetical protein
MSLGRNCLGETEKARCHSDSVMEPNLDTATSMSSETPREPLASKLCVHPFAVSLRMFAVCLCLFADHAWRSSSGMPFGFGTGHRDSLRRFGCVLCKSIAMMSSVHIVNKQIGT